MRAAPAVEAMLGPCGRERALIILLHAGSAAVLAAWGLALCEVAEAWLWWAVWLACVASAGLAGRRWAAQELPATPQALGWDGRSWALRSGPVGAAGDVPLAAVIVAIDLGSWVLLRLHPATDIGGCWRVASAGGSGASWHGLRLAMRAHAGVAARAPDGADT
jgi:hypothetical protein